MCLLARAEMSSSQDTCVTFLENKVGPDYELPGFRGQNFPANIFSAIFFVEQIFMMRKNATATFSRIMTNVPGKITIGQGFEMNPGTFFIILRKITFCYLCSYRTRLHVSWLEDTCVLTRRHMCPG